jgi:amino acid adenylation domain-containing protein
MNRLRMASSECESLVELVCDLAAAEPESAVFSFLADGPAETAATISRSDLDRRARAMAVRIERAARVGDRALLLFPPGLEFLVGFFGCLYAGVVAVPAYVPRRGRPMTRLRAIVADARPCVVLTSSVHQNDMPAWEAGVPELRGACQIVTDLAEVANDADPAEWVNPGAQSDTLAFLQYTSGSTATPKGVMITHGNLLDNSRRIQACFCSSHDARGVFWLPTFHDMGLIGGVIQTVYCGAHSTLFSPVSFLQRPLRWLQAIARTRASISGAPNFAYDLCVEKTTPEERHGLDLSSWRVAFNGAEPVRPETLERFAEAFAPSGFRREAFLPCYGLAEATLLVSAGPSGRSPTVIAVDAQALGRGQVMPADESGRQTRLAGSGQVTDGHRVLIVDPATGRPSGADTVGEIWVEGPSVAQGYWGRPAETAERLKATLDDDPGPFLRTGDLGFLRGGELFVTGRIKDMIILYGRNIYPQDLEWTIERCHPAIRGGGAAAFAIEACGEERLAVVAEIERRRSGVELDELFTAIRRAVAVEHDVQVHAIRLIKMFGLPRTSSGKVQRHACRDAFVAGTFDVIAEWTHAEAPVAQGVIGNGAVTTHARAARDVAGAQTPSRENVSAWLAAKVAGPLGIDPKEVDVRRPLASFGIGSLQAVRLAADLEEWLRRPLNATLVYDYPTIESLAAFLGTTGASPAGLERPDHSVATEPRGHSREPIAIIGMACRFPGAGDPASFWQLLRDGVEGVGPSPQARWGSSGATVLDQPARGGFVDGIDEFDAEFFGIAPREAVYIDPQHRMLLELAWEALEDGGQVPERLAGGAVGVFIGIATNDYAQLQAKRGGASDAYRITGNAASIAANRISHHFDFHGPSLAIDTACSSSLVAITLACRSLWDGESVLALAGGVNLILAPEVHASFVKAGFLAPDGRCKTFDASANGYVRGEGAGLVVLKPLSQAEIDGDTIYAVIRGAAINQDGRTNGLTAPSRAAQEAVLRAAYRHAGVVPAQVDYVEAHGTGTLLGDPIELTALGSVLGEGRDADRPCALGSAKTNIGHLEAAAGVAGVIKTALMLHHGALPPSLNYSRPNPLVSLDALRLRVQCSLEKWPVRDRPALAGVSSFGFGGTNAHLVLEQAPARAGGRRNAADAGTQPEHLIPLSAKSPEALCAVAQSLRHALADARALPEIRDIAYSAGARRGHHDYRLAIIASDVAELSEALDCYARGELHLSNFEGRQIAGRQPGLAFIFSDRSILRPTAARALLESEPAFRAAVTHCDSLQKSQLGWSPLAKLVAETPASPGGYPEIDPHVQFLLQVGLAELWKSWGVAASASVGDGAGAFAAAVYNGAMTLEQAILAVGKEGSGPQQFSARVAELAGQGIDIFVELGTHPTSGVKAAEAARRCGRAPLVLATLRAADLGVETMRWSAAVLYTAGFDLAWSRVSGTGQPVRLPSYPWRRRSFWIDAAGNDEPSVSVEAAVVQQPSIGSDAAPNGLYSVSETAEKRPDAETRSLASPAETPRTAPSFNLALRAALTPEERRPLLIAFVRDRLAGVLGLEPDRVDLDKPLLSLGLDSLSGMDLKMELDSGLGIVLPMTSFMEGASARVLAERADELLAAPASAEPPSATSEPPRDETGETLLSHEQQLLWYAHQFTTTGAAYHNLGAASVPAALDFGALRRAFRTVISEQDALRTTIAVVDEKPVVRILSPDALGDRADLWLVIENVATLNERAVSERMRELARSPFDFERGPLFRLHILSRSATDHILILIVHHIISDFWSMAVLVDDLGKNYAAERSGRARSTVAPRSHYGDFARWQRAMVSADEGARHWEYWRTQLATPLPILNLPTDFARPAVPSYQGAITHFYLDVPLTQAVIELGESRGTSLYATLLAAFQIFLGRYSGQDDIVVGSPVAGRTRPGLEGLIGYFVNMLPMRSERGGNPSFSDFLARVRRTVALGLEHQDFPFGVMVNRLEGQVSPGRAPVFQVMFAHQKAQRLGDEGLAPFALGVPGTTLDIHGLTAHSIGLDKQTALFDLTMMTALDGNRLCVGLEYSTDLFRPATIDRMAEGFQSLLEAIVARPDAGISDLTIVSPREHQHLVELATAPQLPHHDSAIHHRFERQVKLTPDATALVWSNGTLSYRALDNQANHFARRLREFGVRTETVVGLYLEEWHVRIVALLGVLKAGGAYLPLDTELPAERIAAMLEDSGADMIITTDQLRGRIPPAAARIVTFTPDDPPLAAEPCAAPGATVDASNLAYVIFTSGSTGRPKGVAVEHGSLLASATAWEHCYRLNRPGLRHLQAAGFAFDVFTGDWVRALTTGGTLVECPRQVLLDPPALAKLIHREQIGCLELVPALAEALAAHLESQGADLAGVEILSVGSDTVRERLYGRLCRLVGAGGTVVNSYGLTEATIDSTFWTGSIEDLPSGDGSLPIGRPFPGARVYVLDERYALAPIGVTGELFIGGAGVARGYVSKSRQTAERFVPDPFGAPGSRLYATGDRARWRDTGALELLGRQDGQVKVRGYRVELAEVEGALARHPQIAEAAVVALGEPGKDRRLAAYLVPSTSDLPTVAELRRWLKDRMPDPMVPSSFTLVDAMPLSPNGKIDRSALPVPGENDDNASAAEYVAPRTGAEDTLAGIVRELLSRSRVSVTDDFFEIGVDSIIGIQIVSRARQAGLALGPMDLFRHPNIAELAALASSMPAHERPSEPPPGPAPFALAPEGVDVETLKLKFQATGGIDDLHPLTPMQEGMLFHALADPDAGHYVEQFTCRIRGSLDAPNLQRAWDLLAARHGALRSTIHWVEFDRPCQIVHRKTEQPIQFHDWRGLDERTREDRLAAYLAADHRRGFHPSQPPLSRLSVLTLENDVHQFVWSIHHAVIDGWCLSVLLHELLDIEEALRDGREPVHQPTRPFRDYVAWLRGREFPDGEAYWRGQLAGVRTAMPLGIEGTPSTHGDARRDRTGERQIIIGSSVTAALGAFARAERVTLNTLLQGAWAILLSRYSGRDDVLFGVTVSGRPSELDGVESMVGMFINSLPLRISVNEQAMLIPWLRDVQSTLVAMRRFEAIPLSRIQAWTDVPAGMPLFESIVIVQNLPFVNSLKDRAARLGIESACYLERTHYPLAVTVIPGDELLIKIGFDSDRFDDEVIERMLGHLSTLLDAMSSQSRGRLVELPMLSQTEQEALIGRAELPLGDSGLDETQLERFSESDLDALIERLR